MILACCIGMKSKAIDMEEGYFKMIQIKYLTLVSILGSSLFFSNLFAQPRDSVLVWSDEFDKAGFPDITKWNYEQGYVRNNELQYFTVARPENARVENGSLIIEARNDNWKGNAITSASLTTKGLGEWQYGRFDIRARFATIKGSWPAIWLLAENSQYGGWPAGGEIDIMENVGFEPNTVHGTVHTLGVDPNQHNGWGQPYSIPNLAKTWHVYSAVWTPDSILIQADGITYMRYPNQKSWQMWPFDQEFFLMLGLSIGGDWGGQQGVDYTALPIKLEVDYARVYKIKTGSAAYSLVTSVFGHGHVEKNSDMATYPALTLVTLNAIPDPGSTFVQWSNGSIKKQLEIVIDHNVQIEAQFLPSNELLLQSTFPYGLGKWFFWHDANLIATQSIVQGEVCIAMLNSQGQDWQSQLDYRNLKVRAGEEYELSFSAHAGHANRPIRISLVNENSHVLITPAWATTIGINSQIYLHRFTIATTDDNVLLQFAIGQDTTQICMSQFSLKLASPSLVSRRLPSVEKLSKRDWFYGKTGSRLAVHGMGLRQWQFPSKNEGFWYNLLGAQPQIFK